MHVFFSGTQNTLLLLSCDAFQTAAIEAIFPEANFDKNQRITLLKNEVNFTSSSAIVSGNQFESLLLEIFTARIFCMLAYAMTRLVQSRVKEWVL